MRSIIPYIICNTSMRNIICNWNYAKLQVYIIQIGCSYTRTNGLSNNSDTPNISHYIITLCFRWFIYYMMWYIKRKIHVRCKIEAKRVTHYNVKYSRYNTWSMQLPTHGFLNEKLQFDKSQESADVFDAHVHAYRWITDDKSSIG